MIKNRDYYHFIKNALLELYDCFCYFFYGRIRYDLVFHIRAMRIILSMTTPYARHALRHARVTVAQEWRILRSAAKVTVNEVYIVSLVSPREFLIRHNWYLVKFAWSDVHECIYYEPLHVAVPATFNHVAILTHKEIISA